MRNRRPPPNWNRRLDFPEVKQPDWVAAAVLNIEAEIENDRTDDNLPPVRDIGLAAPVGVLAREPSVGGEQYFVFARELTDYRELPITVGTYFLKRAVDGPIRRGLRPSALRRGPCLRLPRS